MGGAYEWAWGGEWVKLKKPNFKGAREGVIYISF